MEQHQRKTDNCFILKFWEQVGPYWHIGTGTLLAVYVAISWINGVQASQKDVDLHTKQITELQNKNTDIVIEFREKNADLAGDVKVVKQRIDDIANYMGVPKRK